jgi:RHS repeat-associated protein
MSESADAVRRFTPDSRTAGAYFAGTGDSGKLRKLAGGVYELTEARGTVTRFRADGLLDYVQDPNGNRITAFYTAGRLTRLTHTSDVSLEITYNVGGKVATVTDSAGRTTLYLYDPSLTYLVAVLGSDGRLTRYDYQRTGAAAGLHALTSVIEPGDRTRTFAYTAAGRLLSTNLNGNVGRVDFTYDTAGRVTATDLAGVQQSLFFDQHGFVLRQEDGTGNYLLTATDDAGRPVRVTDAAGRVRTYSWCDCGQLKTATDELGHTVQFTLGGPFNHPTVFTDARGNQTRYAYDANGNRLTTTHADGSVERIAYDARGNPTTLTNRRGQPVQYAYNPAGQVTRETFPDGTHNDYVYDTRGRLTSAVSAQGTTAFTYDPTTDWLTRVDYPAGRWLQYAYDAGGRRTQMTDETGFIVKYAYDAAGRLTSLKDAADAVIVTYTYDAGGRLSREDKGNGTYTITSYDAAGRVEHIVHHAPTGAVNSRFDYTYDATGRRTGMSTLDGTWAYTYDLTGQLTRAVFASNNMAVIPDQDEAYFYDAAGNRTQTIINGVTTTYTTNVLNQYTAVGATTYQYDRDGNLIAEVGQGGVSNYGYDIYDQLTQVDGPQGSWQYEYNAFGDRTATIADGQRREFLLDASGIVNVIGEYHDGTRITSFAHGVELEASQVQNSWQYYDFDAIGSVAGITNSAGIYANRYAYLPFGGFLHESGSLFNQFTFVGAFGVMSDDSGLLYMCARFENPQLGRFLQADPLGISDGMNVYSYVHNQPVSAIDPKGLYYVRARRIT